MDLALGLRRQRLRDLVNANGWMATLVRVATNKQIFEDERCLAVLFNRLAFKYNGDGWYDVHPLVAELPEFQRGVSGDPADPESGPEPEAGPVSERAARLLPPERLLTEDNARAYRRFLDWSVGAGFKLGVVEIADPWRRDALVAWTSAIVPGTRTLRLDEANREPLRDLVERAASPPGEMAALVLQSGGGARPAARVRAASTSSATSWCAPSPFRGSRRGAPQRSALTCSGMRPTSATSPGCGWPMVLRTRRRLERVVPRSRSARARGGRSLRGAESLPGLCSSPRRDDSRSARAGTTKRATCSRKDSIARPEGREARGHTVIEGRLLRAAGRFGEARERFEDVLRSCEGQRRSRRTPSRSTSSAVCS